MRDSINYNLNYFIMRMSGTKPLKNTMRKSPIKQEMANNASEIKTNPDVTSKNNNRAGVGVHGKKTYGKAAAAKRLELKNNKSMKDTVRKPSPMKQESTGKKAVDAVMVAKDKLTAVATKAKKEASNIKGNNTSTSAGPRPTKPTKPTEGKPNASSIKPSSGEKKKDFIGKLQEAKAKKDADKARGGDFISKLKAAKAKKEGTTPAMQLKKHKC